MSAADAALLLAVCRGDAEGVAAALADGASAKRRFRRADAAAVLGPEAYLGSQWWASQTNYPLMYFVGARRDVAPCIRRACDGRAPPGRAAPPRATGAACAPPTQIHPPLANRVSPAPRGRAQWRMDPLWRLITRLAPPPRRQVGLRALCAPAAVWGRAPRRRHQFRRDRSPSGCARGQRASGGCVTARGGLAGRARCRRLDGATLRRQPPLGVVGPD